MKSNGRWSVAAPARPWAAYDDNPSLFRPDCHRLVLRASEVGLSEAQLKRLDAMLCDERRTADGDDEAVRKEADAAQTLGNWGVTPCRRRAARRGWRAILN